MDPIRSSPPSSGSGYAAWRLCRRGKIVRDLTTSAAAGNLHKFSSRRAGRAALPRFDGSHRRNATVSLVRRLGQPSKRPDDQLQLGNDRRAASHCWCFCLYDRRARFFGRQSICSVKDVRADYRSKRCGTANLHYFSSGRACGPVLSRFDGSHRRNTTVSLVCRLGQPSKRPDDQLQFGNHRRAASHFRSFYFYNRRARFFRR